VELPPSSCAGIPVRTSLIREAYMAQRKQGSPTKQSARTTSRAPRTVAGVSGWALYAVIGLLVVGLAAGVIGIYAYLTRPKPVYPPTAFTGTVHASKILPTIALTWVAPANSAGKKVSYTVNMAAARLSGSVTASSPFQAPCIQDVKSSTATTVTLPTVYDNGVFYADVTAHVAGRPDAVSSPLLVYGPFSKKDGQSTTATRPAKGAIPAFEWCKAQSLGQ
jgi:hypothetical protein